MERRVLMDKRRKGVASDAEVVTLVKIILLGLVILKR